MKLTIIGIGQCGGRIADEFARCDSKARRHRGISIAPAVFAVNTDAADLSGLVSIPRDYTHRILIGGRRTGGHGVGKINELASEIAKQDGDRIFHAIRANPRSFESDAFLLVASAAGGTGSGAISVISRILRERYLAKPIYALLVLPFEHEQLTEERTTYNTALCVKTVNSVADAVILVDNQRYVGKGASIRGNFTDINRLVVEPFYDLLCAGEETKVKHIGGKTLDAGDIMETMGGWTAIGYGISELSVFNFPFRMADFRKKETCTRKGIQAMDKALGELSISCSLPDTRKALYLLAGPPAELNTELVQEAGDYLRGLLPEATIRNGDYPRNGATMGVYVVLSGLTNVEKVRDYYARTVQLIREFRDRDEESEARLKEMEEVGKDLPSLL